MSATTFSIAPFDANQPKTTTAAGDNKKPSFTRPPTITLPLPSTTTSHAAAQHTSPSPPPPPLAPTSASTLSLPHNATIDTSGARTRAPARSLSPPPLPPRKARNKSPARSLPYPPLPPVSPPPGAMKSAMKTTREVEKTPAFLTEPHHPVYQTHTTLQSEGAEGEEGAGSLTSARGGAGQKRVTMGGVDGSVEDRRARFYRFLHTYHIHASEDDLSRHDVIFPPGLLSIEGGMETFLTEFTALQSSYSALLSLVSSLPHLCLTLNADGFMTAYNMDPSSFFGLTLTVLTSQPYQRWFDSTSSSSSLQSRRSTTLSTRNTQLLSSIALAYSSRETIREEHLMFMGSKGRATPCAVTIIPVLHHKAGVNTTSFDHSFAIHLDNTSAPDDISASSSHSSVLFSASSSAATPVTAHAFRIDEDEQREMAERKERAAREERRGREIRRVVLIIENKELIYRLGQQTKRVKEALKPERRRSSHEPGMVLAVGGGGGGGGTDGDITRRRSVGVVQPKLDTGISSALTLMSTLAAQERNVSKRRMYAEIMHMLSHSKGMESVNDDVINQIEDDAEVGKELKSWLINQINPTNSSEDRIEEKEKEKEAKKAEDDAAAVEEGGGGDRGLMRDPRLSSPGRLLVQLDGNSPLHSDTGGTAATAEMKELPLSPPPAVKPSPKMSASSAPPLSGSGGVGGGGGDGGRSDGPTLPRSLSHHADDGQFVDPSPEVSLLARKRPGTGGGSGASSHHGSISMTGRGSERKHSRVRKERRSLAEKRSINIRNSLTTPTPIAKLQSNTSSPAVTPTPSFAPLRSPVSLPLGLPMQERHQPVERAADARVLYNNWSAPSAHPAARSSSIALQQPQVRAEDDTGSAAEEGSGVVVAASDAVIRESVFTQVGCPPPEVHHNAALDCNSQTLFWSNLQAHSLRPTTVPGGAAIKAHTLLHSPVYLTPSAESALASTLSVMSLWNQFNIFQVSTHSQGWPLTFTFTTIITQLRLIGKWGIDAVLLSNFIREVERGYFANPYHSSTHAADVLQHSYHMITQTHLDVSLSDLDVFILLVAAALHDYGHPGVNNQYLTTSFSPLALQYNDRNVLESYHIASVFLMMANKPETNLFQHMDTVTYRKARKMLIDLVLATDLASHFDILAVWKRKESILDCNKDEDKLLVMQMILKSGDLGHPSRVRHLHLTWSELITEEFFQQGDREKKNGMNVSAMMDRNTCNIVTSQIGFISFLVMPIYTAFSPYIGTDMYAMTVKANLAMWERLNLESDELRRMKEEEEMELRRLVMEKEVIESRKRKEQQERDEAQRRQAALWEAEMQKQTEEEEEAKRKEDEMIRAKALMDAELKEDAQRLPSDNSAIIDVQLRREIDAEWTLADISDSGDEDEDDADAHSEDDDDEEAERMRRRSRKLQQTESERAEARQQRKQEKLEYRMRKKEERRNREEDEREAELKRQQEEGKLNQDTWERSKEREDQEIEGRLRAISATIRSKLATRGRGDSADAEDEEVAAQTLREAQQRKKREFEQHQNGSRDGAESEARDEHDADPTLNKTHTEVEQSEDDKKLSPDALEDEQQQPSQSDAAQAELVASAAAALPVGVSPRVVGEISAVPFSPDSAARAVVGEKMRASIARDRERVDAESERQRSRVQKERTRLMSAQERKAAEETGRLERKVKRLLRREQAKARAKAKQDEIDSLLETVDGKDIGKRESGASKKERVLDSARQRGKTLALREVSMLMLDKEWGVRRDKAEENRIMNEYLQYVSDDEDDQQEEEHDDEDEEDYRRRLEAPVEERKKARLTVASSPPVPSLPAVVPSHHAEEWEDESERDQHRVSVSSTTNSNEEMSDNSNTASNRHSRDSSSDSSNSAAGLPLDAATTGTEGRRGRSRRSSRSVGVAAESTPVQPIVERHEEEKEGMMKQSDAVVMESHGYAATGALQRVAPVTSVPGSGRRQANEFSITLDSQTVMKATVAALAAVRQGDTEPQHDSQHRQHHSYQQHHSRHGGEGKGDAAAEDGEHDGHYDRVQAVHAEQSCGGEEEKEEALQLLRDVTGDADAEAEKQRRRDKQRALASQQQRAMRERAQDRQREASGDRGGRQPHRAMLETSDRHPSLPSPSQSSSSPSLSSHPIPSSISPTSASSSFTSFPPLTPATAAARSVAAAMVAPGSAANEGLFLSRSLVPSKGAEGSLYRTAQSGEIGSDWHAVEDEQAMVAILRRVIPRSRQAELERARRAIITKAKMRTMK